MNIPKKVQILNFEFEILKTKERIGGAFHFSMKENNKKPTIKIGNHNQPWEQYEIFLHEICEIIMEVLRVRYIKPDNEEYEFHLDHRSFDTFCKILAGILFKIK